MLVLLYRIIRFFFNVTAKKNFIWHYKKQYEVKQTNKTKQPTNHKCYFFFFKVELNAFFYLLNDKKFKRKVLKTLSIWRKKIHVILKCFHKREKAYFKQYYTHYGLQLWDYTQCRIDFEMSFCNVKKIDSFLSIEIWLFLILPLHVSQQAVDNG